MTSGLRPPLKVTVAGGSLGGLCAAAALRRIGAEVDVYERTTGPMDTRGAGIVVQPTLVNLLRQVGAPALPTTGCRVRRYLEPDGGNGVVQSMPQRFTSWEAIYSTLRKAFPDDRYHMGRAVAAIRSDASKAVAAIEGGADAVSDLVVGADGASSLLRRTFLPEVSAKYAGYVAWRGVLDEEVAQPHLVSFFDDAFTFSEARSGGHILVYMIPGEGADVVPGRRRLNWVWYVAIDPDDLPAVLTDMNGDRHHASLPQGLVSRAAIDALRADAFHEVHPRLAELVAATPDPFLQTIVDVSIPRTVFDRTILMGDAAFVVRPHTAGAAAKAAFDASTLAASIHKANGDLGAALKLAEKAQLEYGRQMTDYGIALGSRWASKPATPRKASP